MIKKKKIIYLIPVPHVLRVSCGLLYFLMNYFHSFQRMLCETFGPFTSGNDLIQLSQLNNSVAGYAIPDAKFYLINMLQLLLHCTS
jgi:hypothetical protein